MGFSWILHGLHMDSTWILHRFYMGSTWILHGVLQGFKGEEGFTLEKSSGYIVHKTDEDDYILATARTNV